MKGFKEDAENKLKELNIQLNTLSANKDKEVYEIEKKLRQEFHATSEGAFKDLEGKIRSLESARAELSSKNMEYLEKVKQYEKGNAMALAKAEKDINLLKEEITTLQKENAGLLSKIERAQNEQQMNTSTMEARFGALSCRDSMLIEEHCQTKFRKLRIKIRRKH